MSYSDFTLIYADGSKNLLGISSALYISRTNTKKSIFLHKIFLYFLPNYTEFYLL